MEKQFALVEETMNRLVSGDATGIATDRITVDGELVGYMYREEPTGAKDSGWRFCEGTESPDYLVEVENSETLALNTIANYDPAIVPYLDTEVGTALVRKGDAFVVELLPEEGQ